MCKMYKVRLVINGVTEEHEEFYDEKNARLYFYNCCVYYRAARNMYEVATGNKCHDYIEAYLYTPYEKIVEEV